MNHAISTLTLATLLATAAIGVQAKQYVFPEKGQTAEQQSQDEYTCHNWATYETGYDPTNVKPVQAASTATTTQEPVKQGADAGSGAHGALRGAAVGGVIGAIADEDKSDAAAKGAAIGVVAGRSRSRRHNAQEAQQQQQAQAQAQADAQAQQQQQASATSAQQAEYFKARGVCLEAKGYSVN